MHSSHTINLQCCKTFVIAEIFEMLQVGVSLLSIFNGTFSAKWAIQPPSNNVAVIPDKAIIAKINEIKKVYRNVQK